MTCPRSQLGSEGVRTQTQVCRAPRFRLEMRVQPSWPPSHLPPGASAWRRDGALSRWVPVPSSLGPCAEVCAAAQKASGFRKPPCALCYLTPVLPGAAALVEYTALPAVSPEVPTRATQNRCHLKMPSVRTALLANEVKFRQVLLPKELPKVWSFQSCLDCRITEKTLNPPFFSSSWRCCRTAVSAPCLHGLSPESVAANMASPQAASHALCPSLQPGPL